MLRFSLMIVFLATSLLSSCSQEITPTPLPPKVEIPVKVEIPGATVIGTSKEYTGQISNEKGTVIASGSTYKNTPQ